MSRVDTTLGANRRPRGRPRKSENNDSGSHDRFYHRDRESSSKPSTSKDEPRSRHSRARKERKLYSDEWALGDDEIDGNINVFSIADKVDAPRFSQNFVKEMNGPDFNLAYLQRHGFNTPILFKEKVGLGLQVPSSSFTVNDVRTCVGSRRILDVMDVATQKNFEMTMKEWQKYYDDPRKDKLLNVISLEFSHTRLENYIRRPNIVRLLDWVDCVWPRHLKEAQRESTNALDDMMYPKVQKYCLMSVKGCYTDFHIDFGGTSVWYHILKGGKVFWLIPPTEHNIQLYEQWVLSGKQGDIFFGDTVEKCGRVVLTEGNTFFIPTGWIHAVYTLKDSLVFGGNFLHSFGIEKQLRIAQVEDATKVPHKFRYPFFTEMLWYVLERYVYCLLGKSHLKERNGINENRENVKPSEHIHLTPQELHGLKAIIKYVYTLPSNKKNVPDLITDPILLIKDVRTLIELHCHDSPELSVTGRPVLPPQTEKQKRAHHMPPHDKEEPKIKIVKNHNSKVNLNGPRRRRTRCKNCEACKQSDCGECPFCLDMVKFGGPGKAKQTCVMRQCLQPMLPVTAACVICGLDGWGQQIIVPITKLNKSTPSSLMECSVCYEILHPDCIAKSIPDIEGVVNEDLPNSWECPKCCKDGKNIEYKPRHFRARQKSSDMRRCSVSSGDIPSYRRTLENNENLDDEDSDYSDAESNDARAPSIASSTPSGSSIKRRKIEPSEPYKVNSTMSTPSSYTPRVIEENTKRVEESTSSAPVSIPEPRKLALRTQLANQLTGNTIKALKRPLYPVRPAPVVNKTGNIETNTLPSYMSRSALLFVFKWLSPMELGKCALVCKTWSNVSVDPSLWKKMDVTSKRLTAACLAGIARRQPETLIMDWTAIAKRQLEWLIARLPQLRELSLQGCSWNGVAALRTCNCPPLTSLDLSFVTGMNDSSLRDILSPPKDTRPGLIDTKSRLRNLRTLKLAGCEISDVSLRYIVQNIPLLSTLDLSQCFRLTDAGIAQLTAPPATTLSTLSWLDLSGCSVITDASLDHLSKCTALKYLDLRRTTQITTTAINKFVSNKNDLQIIDDKLLVKIS
ncbi:hypothetical protein PGB90_005218 [Kerria lacca]